jgi:type IV pilus assembly protein PilB
MFINEKDFQTFVIDSGLVSKADVLLAVKEAKDKNTSLTKTLVSMGKMSDDDVRKIIAKASGIAFVDLRTIHIDFEILSLIPEPIARKNNIIAYKKDAETLEVAMLDPNDLSAIEFIKKKVNLRIVPRLTDADSMKSALIQYQKSLKAEFGDLIKNEADSIKTISEEVAGGASESDLKKLADDMPVIRIVDTLLKHAILQSASDIHIEPQEKELVVRYRIDGLLHDAMILPKSAETSITARIKVLSKLKLDEKRLPQDGRFKIDLNDEKVSFRVSILPTYYGEKTVMRVLREGGGGFTLEHLGFHGLALERIHEATGFATGMILATGPTGSGKSTTLYTLLDILNTPDVNISTVEDPVEYQMPRVNQTQVRPDIGFTFSVGLRTLVRQDPDIIMVGEIRDGETASLGVNAALTGHLVLSTLHTNSAAGAIPRLLDMKIEPFLLVSTLSVVIGQRLIRKLHLSKEKRKLTEAEIKALGKIVNLDRMMGLLKEENVIGPQGTWSDVEIGVPVPSTEAPDGYKGRLGIHEVLRVTPSIKDLIMKGATATDVEDQAKKEGMVTMIEDGVFLAIQGKTTIEEVLRVVTE